MSRKEDEDVCVTQLYRSPGPLPTRPWGVLTELVSYMYSTYVHYIICTYLTSYLSFLAQGTDLTEIARLGLKVSEE